MEKMQYKVGDLVKIKDYIWYNDNKDEDGDVPCGEYDFVEGMKKYCSETFTICQDVGDGYLMMEDDKGYVWTDEMIDCLVEEETKPKFKVGDRVITDTNMKGKIIEVVEEGWYRVEFEPHNRIPQPNGVVPEESMSLVEEEIKPKFKVGDKITNGKDTLTILTLSSDRYVVEDTFGECGTLYFNFVDDWKIVEDKDLKYKVGDIVFSTIWRKSVLIKDIRPNRFYLIADLEYLSRTMITYESNLKPREDDIEKDMGEHQKNVDDIMAIQGIEPIEAEMEEVWHCPEGYVFKDEHGNIINTTKIVLEKTEVTYPKTFLGCCDVLGIEDTISRGVKGYKSNLLDTFQKLIICRDAYWKLAGEEMGLDGPWEPDWTTSEPKYVIACTSNGIENQWENTYCKLFAFPTEKLRDIFNNNFKEMIKQCLLLLKY